MLWGSSGISKTGFFRLEPFQNANFAHFFWAFSPRDVDRCKCCKLSSTVASLSHWASTFVYNSLPWRRASIGSPVKGETYCWVRVWLKLYESVCEDINCFGGIKFWCPYCYYNVVFEGCLKTQDQEMKDLMPGPENAGPKSKVPECTDCYWNRWSFVITKILHSGQWLPMDGKESTHGSQKQELLLRRTAKSEWPVPHFQVLIFSVSLSDTVSTTMHRLRPKIAQKC